MKLFIIKETYFVEACAMIETCNILKKRIVVEKCYLCGGAVQHEHVMSFRGVLWWGSSNIRQVSVIHLPSVWSVWTE